MEKHSSKLTKLVEQALHHPKNLATESELVEYANSALSAFLEADADSTETLTSPELIRLCSNMGLPMEDDEEEGEKLSMNAESFVIKIFNINQRLILFHITYAAFMKIDADDSGQISVEEWISWWLKRVSCLPNPLKQQEAIARNTFRKFDTDETGSLDTSELHELINSLGIWKIKRRHLITVCLLLSRLIPSILMSLSIIRCKFFFRGNERSSEAIGYRR